MLISTLCWAAAAVPIVSLAIFATEVVAGLPQKFDAEQEQLPHATAAVLIPAHNESASIATTIARLRKALERQTQILVVADNCSDDTAARARAAGADVVERQDAVRLGKGFALDFGRAALAGNPPDAVIILDADCVVMPGSIERLADRAAAWGVPVQGINLLSGSRTDAPMVQVSNFAFLVKNLVRWRGVSRLGGAAPLGGTGMAFPWQIFAEAKLASDEIVEDLKLAVDLARAGRGGRFTEAARVESPPAPADATIGQRSRWEHGFIATMRAHALPVLGQGIASRRWPLIWLGLHLLVPPLTLLITASGAIWAILIVVGWFTNIWGPALVLGVMLGLAVTVTMMAWVGYGRSTLAPMTLVKIPGYLLWKLPVYGRLLIGKTTGWNRTRRAGD
jgi:cellulose synthase/poly-beta-1,6-N-acetylglucosamine synthase-like glycosyltransferase